MIRWDALGVLLSGLLTSRLMTSRFIDSYFEALPTVLWRLPWLSWSIDLIAIIGFIILTFWSRKKEARLQRQRFTVVWVSIGCMLMLIFTSLLYIRVARGPVAATHDGAIQTEAAADLLLHGKNPYAENYSQTLFGYFGGPEALNKYNPAWDYYAYPPLTFLLTTPLVIIGHWFQTAAEARLIYILSALAFSILLIRRVQESEKKSAVLLLTLGNPLIMLFPLIGFNDSLAVFFLLVAGMLTAKRQWVAAGIVMALALASKQTAWLVFPVWLLWLWQMQKVHRIPRRDIHAGLIALVLTTIILFGPFVLWDWRSMWDDLVRYVGGSIPYTYPVAGSSLWQIGVIAKIFTDPWATPSIRWIQIPVMLVSIGVALWQVRRRPTLGQWLSASAILITVVGLIQRSFFDNYLSVIIMMAVAAVVIQDTEHEST